MTNKIVVTCLLCAFMASAQKPDTTIPYKNRLGIRYSNLSGYGASYQYVFLKQYAVRATGFIKYYEYIRGDKSAPIESEKNIYYNVGIDFQRNIIKDRWYRVYSIAAGGYMADRDKPRSKNDEIRKTTVAGGIGCGMELNFRRLFFTDLSFLYSFHYIEGKHSVNPHINNENTKKTVLGVSAGISVGY